MKLKKLFICILTSIITVTMLNLTPFADDYSIDFKDEMGYITTVGESWHFVRSGLYKYTYDEAKGLALTERKNDYSALDIKLAALQEMPDGYYKLTVEFASDADTKFQIQEANHPYAELVNSEMSKTATLEYEFRVEEDKVIGKADDTVRELKGNFRLRQFEGTGLGNKNLKDFTIKSVNITETAAVSELGDEKIDTSNPNLMWSLKIDADELKQMAVEGADSTTNLMNAGAPQFSYSDEKGLVVSNRDNDYYAVDLTASNIVGLRDGEYILAVEFTSDTATKFRLSEASGKYRTLAMTSEPSKSAMLEYRFKIEKGVAIGMIDGAEEKIIQNIRIHQYEGDNGNNLISYGIKSISIIPVINQTLTELKIEKSEFEALSKNGYLSTNFTVAGEPNFSYSDSTGLSVKNRKNSWDSVDLYNYSLKSLKDGDYKLTVKVSADANTTFHLSRADGDYASLASNAIAAKTATLVLEFKVQEGKIIEKSGKEITEDIRIHQFENDTFGKNTLDYYILSVEIAENKADTTTTEKPAAKAVDETKATEVIKNETRPVIKINENDGSVVGNSILQEIKAAEKTVTFERDDGVQIKIDPSKITDNAVGLDLSMDLTFTDKATNITDKVKVPANAIVIAPIAKGDFGLELEITIPAQQLKDANVNGNNIKLFYISDDGKIEDLGKLTLNSDGSVSIKISHASQYVLAEELEETTEITETTENEENKEAEENANTGVALPIISAIAAGTLIIATHAIKRKPSK